LFACGALYLLSCQNYEPTPYTAILREPKILFANHTAAIFQQENQYTRACGVLYLLRHKICEPTLYMTILPESKILF